LHRYRNAVCVAVCCCRAFISYPECIRWIVTTIGFSLFVRRLRAARRKARVRGTHDRVHEHTLTTFITTIMHTSIRTTIMFMVTHTSIHTADAALPSTAGADGTPVTWRSLLALGISGGLLPCPQHSWFLSAIALHRVDTVCCLSSPALIGSNAYWHRTSVRLCGSFVKRSRLERLTILLCACCPLSAPS